jgi:hypothetical protein
VTVVPYARQGRSEFQKDGHYRTGRRIQLAPVARVVSRPCKIVKASLSRGQIINRMIPALGFLIRIIPLQKCTDKINGKLKVKSNGNSH